MTKHLIPLRENGLTPLFGRANPVFPLTNDIGRLFEGLFDSVFDAPFVNSNGARKSFRPNTNVTESDEAVKVELEIPGMVQDELDLTFGDGVLTVRGEKQKDYDEKDGKVHYVGRSYGSFEQRIPLQFDIDDSNIEATVKNGVLSVHLPKRSSDKERTKKIEVQST